MKNKREIFEEAIKSIKSKLKDRIQNVEWYNGMKVMSHVVITLKEDVTPEDAMIVSKSAYDHDEEMQINIIESRHVNGKPIPVSNVIEVALYIGE